MGEWTTLTAADGFALKAWLAKPQGAPKGAVVVIQEIFGVNHHIRSVTERFAEAGYLAIAPAVFDRVEKDVDMKYDQQGMSKGMEIANKLDRAKTVSDVEAAVAAVKSAGKVGIVGFCMGGTYAWIAAAKLSGLSASSGYYGGGILAQKDLQPQIPTILHFGEKDGHIPIDGVRELEKQHPDVPVYVYPADHGFNCDERASYDAPSAKLAWERTMDFFGKNLG